MLEGVVVVVSILIAFSIDTWWTESEEEEEANILLEALVLELSQAISQVEQEVAFRKAKLESASRMLQASTAEVELESGEMDALLNDVTHWGTSSVATGALNALVDSGKLAWLDSLELQTALASWPEKFVVFQAIEKQDQQRLEDQLLPYLAEKASLPKISNAWRGRPGDVNRSVYAPEGQRISDPFPVDHEQLLQDPYFVSLLTMIVWDQGDALAYGREWLHEAEALKNKIDLYLTSR